MSIRITECLSGSEHGKAKAARKAPIALLAAVIILLRMRSQRWKHSR